jgi:hypothetical protein
MTFTHTIRRMAAVVPVAVALAVAAPAGARPFDINQASPVVSAPSTQPQAPAVQSNPDEQASPTRHLGATALFAPPVWKLHRGRPSTIHSFAPAHDQTSRYHVVTDSPAAGSPSPFDWGDAAIGAAGGIGICLLIGGGLVTVTRRRHAQAGSPAAIVG